MQQKKKSETFQALEEFDTWLLVPRYRGLHTRTRERPLEAKGSLQFIASKELGTSIYILRKFYHNWMNLEADSFPELPERNMASTTP